MPPNDNKLNKVATEAGQQTDYSDRPFNRPTNQRNPIENDHGIRPKNCVATCGIFDSVWCHHWNFFTAARYESSRCNTFSIGFRWSVGRLKGRSEECRSVALLRRRSSFGSGGGAKRTVPPIPHCTPSDWLFNDGSCFCARRYCTIDGPSNNVPGFSNDQLNYE